MALTANQRVMIYEDPITRDRPEDNATLVKFIRDMGIENDHSIERWEVRFDDAPDEYERDIWTEGLADA